jgi:hypothetical protein
MLLSLAFLLTFGLVSGCQKKSMTLELVVPNGFSGVLKLRANSANGVELTATNGLVVLVFPASGTLDVKGKLPTLEWHKPVARFADGTTIPIPGPSASVPDNTLALRGLGIRNNNTESWYLVGTADQMQDAMNKFYGFEVPKR